MRPFSRRVIVPLHHDLLRNAQRQVKTRSLHQTRALRRPPQQQQQQRSDPKAHGNFYKSHGRALVKALTLAFFSYQVFYWTWVLLETEQLKDEKGYEIKSLEGEVRLLEEGRKSHRPIEQVQGAEEEAEGSATGKILVEQRQKP